MLTHILADIKGLFFKGSNMENVVIWVWIIPNLPRNKGDGFVPLI